MDSLLQRRLESDAERCRGRDRCHSGGYLLRTMPPSWHPVPACAPRLCCRRAIPHCSGDGAASISKSGPEIKNRCTLEGVNREKLASILKSEPEIKNHFSSKSVLQAKPFSFAATKNRIGRGPRCRYDRCRRNHSSLRQRRPDTFPTSKNFYSTAFARGVTYIILPNYCFE